MKYHSTWRELPFLLWSGEWMSGIENTIIARVEKGGEKFEILVDPKLGYEYKTGKRKDFTNVLSFDEIFKDANKGERQTSSALKKAFGTEDSRVIAEKILREGDLQLTTDQKRKLLEEKHARIIALICRNCIDPKTKTPHPPARIEKALEEAKFRVDAFKSAEEQMQEAVEELMEIIPIRIENIKVAVKISAEYAPKAYGILKEHGLEKEEWGNDGSLMVVCDFPAGIQAEFYDKLNKLTQGSVQTKVL